MVKNLSIRLYKKIGISKKTIHKIVLLLKKELKFEIDEIQINFLNSEKVLKLNRQLLNHDYCTDIITLNYSGSNQLLEGEMFISVEDAVKNSIKYKVKVNVEFLRLIIHGFLHLLGYNDLNKKDRVKMKKLEDKLTENLSYLAK